VTQRKRQRAKKIFIFNTKYAKFIEFLWISAAGGEMEDGKGEA
jgi:hypothetical protein